MTVQSIELLMITGERHSDFNPVSGVGEIIQLFLDGEYENVLKSGVAKQLLSDTGQDDDLELTEIIQRNIKFLLSSADLDSAQRELEVLIVGISYLQLFIQDNWLGPPTKSHPSNFLPESYQHENKREQLSSDAERELCVDGEPVYNLTIHLEYLYLALKILTATKSFQHLQTADWWLMRCLGINQQILDNKSPTLKKSIMSLIDKISKLEPLMTDDKNKDIVLHFHLEAGYLCHTFYEYKEAHAHFNTARKMSDLSIELTGAMGKRTRFQKETKAQLVLSVQRNSPGEASVPYKSSGEISVPDKSSRDVSVPDKTSGKVSVPGESPDCAMPKNVLLDDDTVLNTIEFAETERMFAVELSAPEQALILGLMEDHRRSQASHEKITEEELLAYLVCVLNNVKAWSVAVSALCLRSKLEKGSRRRVERSMMQLEEIVNQTKRVLPPAIHRLEFFYSVNNNPLWIIQKRLAELFLSLGSVGAALEVFERLQLWEDVISCYKRLGKMEKAETLIREQLAIKETPNLWCFLGDVTSHTEYYEKAWELSNQKSARAQRCLGYIYLSREMYPECLACFEKSLNVNSLQIPVWFTYGCAAMTAGEHKLAVKAFKRCVNIDYDNFEAWNNLATAYVRLKEKEKAFRILGEALKCNYENWRIWENYMVVGIDCGQFEDVIYSYHRLMDLRDKWVEVEILKILVRVMLEDIQDANGKPGAMLKPKLRELFGKITARVTTNGEIWRLYAQVCSVDGVENTENRDKILQYLQKSHRCVMQEPNWEKVVERCKEVGLHAMELSKAYVSCSDKAETPSQAIPLLSSAKLMLKGVLTKIKQKHEVNTELVEDLKEICVKLEIQMTDIANRLTEMKNSLH